MEESWQDIGSCLDAESQQLVTLLGHTSSPDPALREPAILFLAQMHTSPTALLKLITLLSEEGLSDVLKLQAGAVLAQFAKNCFLLIKDAEVKNIFQNLL